MQFLLLFLPFLWVLVSPNSYLAAFQKWHASYGTAVFIVVFQTADAGDHMRTARGEGGSPSAVGITEDSGNVEMWELPEAWSGSYGLNSLTL